MSGCQKRMDQISFQTFAPATQLIIRILLEIHNDLKTNVQEEERFSKEIVGTCIVESYLLSLRGSEALLLDLGSLIKRVDDHRKYALMHLPGKLKADYHVKDHAFTTTLKSNSGIEIQKWMSALIAIHEKCERLKGPAITDFYGHRLTRKILNKILH